MNDTTEMKEATDAVASDWSLALSVRNTRRRLIKGGNFSADDGGGGDGGGGDGGDGGGDGSDGGGGDGSGDGGDGS